MTTKGARQWGMTCCMSLTIPIFLCYLSNFSLVVSLVTWGQFFPPGLTLQGQLVNAEFDMWCLKCFHEILNINRLIIYIDLQSDYLEGLLNYVGPGIIKIAHKRVNTISTNKIK